MLQWLKVFCVGCRLLVLVQVLGNQLKKAELSIAHNYKKCDREIVHINKINELQIVDVKKSVVGFGLVDCLGGDRGQEMPPPIENFQRKVGRFSLLLFINCKDILRGFYWFIFQSFEKFYVFSFQKVGGLGGV